LNSNSLSTYTPRIFVDEEIRSGQLLEVSSESDVGGFHIVTHPGVLRPPVRAFVTWLKRQAGAKMTTRS
jgi:LysR family glycine cleavage system transcriptional activator